MLLHTPHGLPASCLPLFKREQSMAISSANKLIQYYTLSIYFIILIKRMENISTENVYKHLMNRNE